MAFARHSVFPWSLIVALVGAVAFELKLLILYANRLYLRQMIFWAFFCKGCFSANDFFGDFLLSAFRVVGDVPRELVPSSRERFYMQRE